MASGGALRIGPLASGAAALVLLTATGASRAEPEPGGCAAHLERGTLLVAGDATGNVIEIIGTARGVGVVCDGAGEAFAGVEEVVVEAGEGDDRITVGNADGPLHGLAVHAFGGRGEDKLMVVGTGAFERFEIAPGRAPGSVRLAVTDAVGDAPPSAITGSGIELLTVEGGEGDDRFESVGLPGVALGLRGGSGDDEWKYVAVRRFAVFLEQSLGRGLEWAVFDGGSGEDRLDLLMATGKQLVQVSGVPDREVPDPEIRVTDVDRELLVADLFVQQTEAVALEAGNGDDRVEIAWDAALMSGLALIRADLGTGDDVAVVHDRTGGEPVAVAVDLGNGDDLLEAAGEIELRARPGRGLDTARATRNLLPFLAEFERVELLAGTR